MAITSISGPKKDKIFDFPRFFYRKKKPSLGRGGVMFQCFVFFLTFAFSCLSFSSFPLRLDFLKPTKSGPSDEVIGKFMCVLSCTRLRVPPVALHVSRYTCRS